MANQQYNLATMPLTRGHYRVLIVSSMEQIIGAALSTIVGVMIPMIVMCVPGHFPSLSQGMMGASPLLGIAMGSALIGYWADRQGYLRWFRICPLIVVIGSLIVWGVKIQALTMAGLFIAGVGVGGGYSLDSSYISEIMPDKWKTFMVGVAKGTSALGFIFAAVFAFIFLREYPVAKMWNCLILFVAGLGVLTFAMRLGFTQSPEWLMERGEVAKARQAARKLLGVDVVVPAPAKIEKVQASYGDLFRGENLKRVILTGIPWACEGMGVYGFGVFLPVLVMALGLEKATLTGIGKIVNSVELTALINFFIFPGFAIGLAVLRRINHIRMLAGGFVVCALGLALLLVAHCMHMPVWVSILGFVIFEMFLNAGPHLVTFILPSKVFPVAIRAAGAGLAATLGKVGAVLGVFFMPLLLRWGGIELLLGVSIAVQIIGAAVAWRYRSAASEK